MEDSDDALRLEGTDWIIERYRENVEKDAILLAGTGELLGEIVELSEDELDEMRIKWVTRALKRGFK
jgi:hypothetical protein